MPSRPRTGRRRPRRAGPDRTATSAGEQQRRRSPATSNAAYQRRATRSRRSAMAHEHRGWSRRTGSARAAPSVITQRDHDDRAQPPGYQRGQRRDQRRRPRSPFEGADQQHGRRPGRHRRARPSPRRTPAGRAVPVAAVGGRVGAIPLAAARPGSSATRWESKWKQAAPTTRAGMSRTPGSPLRVRGSRTSLMPRSHQREAQVEVVVGRGARRGGQRPGAEGDQRGDDHERAGQPGCAPTDHADRVGEPVGARRTRRRPLSPARP